MATNPTSGDPHGELCPNYMTDEHVRVRWALIKSAEGKITDSEAAATLEQKWHACHTTRIKVWLSKQQRLAEAAPDHLTSSIPVVPAYAEDQTPTQPATEPSDPPNSNNAAIHRGEDTPPFSVHARSEDPSDVEYEDDMYDHTADPISAISAFPTVGTGTDADDLQY